MWLDALHTMSRETQIFLALILIFNLYFHIRFTQEIAYKSPAFLTTLGILGTFIGIAFGLMDFDPNNVQKSVPALIDGIKTAVWASAFGIFCALTVKLRDLMKPRRSKKKGPQATVDDMAALLKSSEQLLANIEYALVGEEENTLVNQMRLTRQENQEQRKQLARSLDHYLEHQAERNTQALVEALNGIIRDFNVKLTEQFGENFQRLNIASEQLITWQQRYAEQIDAVAAQQNQAAQNMTTASEGFQSMLAQASVFHNAANGLRALLNGLETQRSQVEANMASLAQFINTASSGLPQLEQHIIEITRQAAAGVQMTNDEFNRNVHDIIEHTKQQVLLLDSALSEELTKSLESFGRQMASLSQKFAQDYGPITERLQAVLKIAG